MGLQKYTKEWLEELCKESYSFAEVLRKAGRKQGGGTQETLRKKIAEYNIDISHFTGQLWSKGKTKENNDSLAKVSKANEQYSVQEVFVKDSPVTQHGLRGYVQRYNIVEYKCSKCGCDGQWQDGQISLELHHIDGDNHNNEISNLTYLCPNCHALTKNFRGKNINKDNKEEHITDEQYIEALQNSSNIRQALISLNLTPAGANYDKCKRIKEQYNI